MMATFPGTQKLLIIAALLMGLIAVGAPDAASETWRAAVPSQVGILRAVWGHSAAAVFAVGDGGTIRHFDGESWQAMESGTDRDLAAVWGSGPARVFAAGAGGTLLYYDGTRWRGLESGTTADLHAVWGTGAGEVFAAGADGVILRFDGAAWRAMAGGTAATIYGLWGNAGANIFAVGGGGRILNFNGSRWYAMESPTGMLLRTVWGASGSDVFAAGSGVLLHYNGRDWQDESGDLRQIHALWGASGVDVYAAGELPDMGDGFVRRYDGTGWHEMPVDVDAPVYGLWGDGQGNLFAVGGSRSIGGVVYQSDEDGWREAWRQPEETLNRGLFGLWANSDTDVFAVGAGGRVLRYDGASWSPVDGGGPAVYRGAWGMDGQLFAVGRNGVARHYDGSQWEDLSGDDIDQDLNAVWGIAPSGDSGGVRLVAVGEDGTVLVHADGVWQAAESGTTADLDGVFGFSESSVFAVGDAGTILHFDGTRWQPMETPVDDRLWGVWGADPTDLFAVGDSNTILHYDGWQWRTLEDDPGASDHFQCVWGRSGTDVYAAGQDGSIQHYDGVEWRRMESGTAAVVQRIQGTPGGTVFAVDSDGAVLRADALSLRLPDEADEGAGSVAGILSIPSPLSSDLAVSLRSDSAIDLTVPRTVTLPAGQTSIAFSVSLPDNDMADGTRWPKVSADAAGLLPAAVRMAVVDNETAALSVDLPGEAFEGADLSGQGRVGMSVAAVRDVTVSLASDNPAAAVVPPTVVIPAGQDHAVFDIRATDDPEIDDPAKAVVTARVAGWGAGAASIVVLDDDRYGLTLAAPPQVREGDGILAGVGRVSVPVPFPEDVPVALASDDTTELTVPAGVVIPAGETSAAFDIMPVRDRLLDNAQPVRISAASPGFRGDAVSIDVVDGDGVWNFVRRGTDVFRDVWGLSSDNVYAVGANGAIFHYDGEAWRYFEDSTSDYTLYGVWGASSENIFAVGGDSAGAGAVLHYDGTVWREMTGGIFETLNSVWGVSETSVYAVGGSSSGGGLILHYDGSEWREIHRHVQELERIWGVSENDIFAVGGDGSILHFNGAGWHEMDSVTEENLYGVWGTSGDQVFAAGRDGVVLAYDGNVWTAMDSGVSDHLYGLWGCSGAEIYAVGRKGLILRYDGEAWRTMESGAEESLWGVWSACSGTGSATVFAVASDGRILRFDGAEWQTSKAPGIDFEDVGGAASEMDAGTHAFIVGSMGTIMEHDGNAWNAVESGFYPKMNGVWGYAADRMFAVGDVGTILAYDGYRWRKSSAPTYADLNGLSGCTTEDGLHLVAVGDDGTILVFDGMQWRTMASGTEADLYGVWIGPASDGAAGWTGFAVGRSGLILHYDGIGWQPMESDATRHLYDVWGSAPSDVYAVGHAGTVLHYDGFHWDLVGTDSKITFRGVWGRSENDVFVVGSVGRILHYDGAEWVGMEAPNAVCESVWGRGRSVLVVGRQNFILRYTDVGIRLPARAVEGDGLMSGQGEVFVEEASTEDRVVTLTSHDPGEIAVPETVVLPAGALSAAFDLTIGDDAFLDGQRRVAVTAVLPGHSLGTAFVSVADNESAALRLILPETVSEGAGSKDGACRIQVDRPVERDVTVTLASTDPAMIRVPAAAVIPQGETDVTFDITAVDNQVFDGERSVEITAAVDGWGSDRKALTVLDNEAMVLELSLPETVNEHDGVLAGAGRMAIPGIWPSDLSVSLAADPTGQLVVPAVVTIPAGRMEVDFDVTVADDALINGDRTVTVSAGATDWAPASESVEVIDNDPGVLRFAAEQFMAREASGAAVVSVRREESCSGRVSVDIETLDGSATAGADYSAVSETLVFEDGESEKAVIIPLSTDDWAEGAESIRLLLKNPGGGAALGAPDAAEVMLAEAVAWQEAGSVTENHLKGIWGADARTVYAVGWRGTILRRDDDGWTDISIDLGEALQLEAVWGSSASDIFAVGAGGLILHSDGGKSFSVQESGTDRHLYGIWGASSRRVYAVGDGVVLGYDGDEWREMTGAGGNLPDLKAVWGGAEDDVFAVGYNGAIVHYDGAAWQPMESGTTAHLYGVWGSSGRDVFAVGAFGAILHFDGDAWRPMESGAGQPVLFLDDVWGSAPDDVFAVGYDGMILHYDGAGWQPMETPGGAASLCAAWGPAGTGEALDLFAVGEGGVILRYAPVAAP